MKLMPLDAIRKALSLERAIALQEEGFRLYTEGKVMMPPVGYMDLGCARGEVHVKTGWIQDDSLFVVKIAGAYPQNPGRGLPTVQGAMVVMNAETGQPEAFFFARPDPRPGRQGEHPQRARRHPALPARR